jgi:hypothetical protein
MVSLPGNFDTITMALPVGSRRPQTFRAACDLPRADQRRVLLHQSPRTFGQPSVGGPGLWLPRSAARTVERQPGSAPRRSG